MASAVARLREATHARAADVLVTTSSITDHKSWYTAFGSWTLNWFFPWEDS